MGRLHIKQTATEREGEEERTHHKAQKTARKSRRLYSDYDGASSSNHNRKQSHFPSHRYVVSYNYTPAGGGLYGSPIVSSPVLRPVRMGLSSKGEKEVDGAGNGVRRLDLGG